MADAVTLLRLYHSHPEDVTVSDGKICFDGKHTFDLKENAVHLGEKSYTIGDIWFATQYSVNYMRKCKEFGMDRLSRGERKQLDDLIKSDSVEPIQVKSLKRQREPTGDEPKAKRPALVPLTLTDTLLQAKQQVAAILDQYAKNDFSEDIDTMNEFVEASTSLSTEIRKRERKLRTRHNILCAVNKNLCVPNSCTEVLSSRRQTTSKSSKVSEKPKKQGTHFIPIIIVPKAGISPLSVDTAAEFFTKGEITKPSDDVKRRAGVPKIASFKQKKGNQMAKFEIMDSIIKLPADQCYRIVAVFVSGAAWQFEGLEWKKVFEHFCAQNIAQLFTHVKGYYMKPEDKTLPEAVTNWNVSVFDISYDKPHTAQSAQLAFWDSMYTHLAKRKFAWRAIPK